MKDSKNKIDKVLALAMSARGAYELGKRIHDTVKERLTYTIKLSSKDLMFSDVLREIYYLTPPQQRRALVLSYDQKSPTRTHEAHDPDRESHLVINGVKVKVSLDSSQAASPDHGRTWNSSFEYPKDLVITCRNQRDTDVIKQWLGDIANQRFNKDNPPRFYKSKSWGDWVSVSNVPRRDLSSVILPEGQLESIVADIQHFLDSEEDYKKRCLPWHRGFLFEGPGGTGKTSLVQALATHFNLDIWHLALADLDSDTKLSDLITEIKGGILLLEDIDVFTAMRDREDDNKVTMSGVLNALDGVGTPNGIITMMTTNHVDKIDPIVLREGRIDRRERLDVCTQEQANRLYEWFYETTIDVNLTKAVGKTPAFLLELFKQNLYEPEIALKELL